MTDQSPKTIAGPPLSAAPGSALPTRVEIGALIKSIADDCAFTMPFWLAGLLVEECRRQGLHTCGYDGDDFRVTVKIKRTRKPNDQAQRRRDREASSATET